MCASKAQYRYRCADAALWAGRRAEVELKLPYVYRSDSTVSRELFTGTGVDRVFETSGAAWAMPSWPRVTSSIRVAMTARITWRAAFQIAHRHRSVRVVTDCTRRCVGPNASGTGLPLDLPTGSGFYAMQPSLTWLYASDPAILFGGVSYLYNFKRNNVSRRVLAGELEPLGTVAPGGVIGFNFGLGLALNDKALISFGYDHSSIARTRQNGLPVPGRCARS
jgi:hypothetical protein